jgi:hypothetical protein
VDITVSSSDAELITPGVVFLSGVDVLVVDDLVI